MAELLGPKSAEAALTSKCAASSSTQTLTNENGGATQQNYTNDM